MKRIIALFLIAVTAMLCSCTATQNANLNKSYNLETDVPYYYRHANTLPIAKSPDGYYIVGGSGIVVYVDKSTMKATPLCNKPNCKHDNIDTCRAYFAKFGESNIQYYKGKIYVLNYHFNNDKLSDEPYLARYEADGTGGTQITDIIQDKIVDWFIHRDYFYYSNDNELFRIPMNNLKSSPQKIFEPKEKAELTENITALNAYGDYIYFKATKKANEDEAEFGAYVMNQNSLKTKELNYNVAGFYKDELITFKRDGNKMRYKIGALDNTESREYEMLDYGNWLWFDPVRKLKVSAEIGETIKQKRLYAYDYSDNELFSAKLEGEYIDFSTAQDEDCFFEFIRKKEKGKDKLWLYYVDKNKTNNTFKLKKLCKLSLAKLDLPPYIISE